MQKKQQACIGLDIIKSRRELANSSLIAGRYICGKQIYRSRNSTVYWGLDTITDHAVVLKKLPEGASTKRVDDWKREGEVLELNSHPGLLRGTGYCLSHSQHWLVMEPVQGELLLDLLSSGKAYRWDKKNKRKVIRNLVESLQSLHRSGWIHGDIKPDNICVDTGDYSTMLLDFGSSQLVQEQQPLRYYSPEWHSPELHSKLSASHAGGKAEDCYGIALIIWSLWVGKHPILSNKGIDNTRSVANWPLKNGLWKSGRWLKSQLVSPDNLELEALINYFG